MPEVPSRYATAADHIRESLHRMGLRPHRVYLVTDTWSQPYKQGTLVSSALVELEPPPRFEFVSLRDIAASGGALKEGDAVLHGISRFYTAEQLKGRDPDGTQLDTTKDFTIAVQAAGQLEAEFYVPRGEPELLSTSWRLPIRTVHRREALDL